MRRRVSIGMARCLTNTRGTFLRKSCNLVNILARGDVQGFFTIHARDVSVPSTETISSIFNFFSKYYLNIAWVQFKYLISFFQLIKNTQIEGPE